VGWGKPCGGPHGPRMGAKVGTGGDDKPLAEWGGKKRGGDLLGGNRGTESGGGGGDGTIAFHFCVSLFGGGLFTSPGKKLTGPGRGKNGDVPTKGGAFPGGEQKKSGRGAPEKGDGAWGGGGTPGGAEGGGARGGGALRANDRYRMAKNRGFLFDFSPGTRRARKTRRAKGGI